MNKKDCLQEIRNRKLLQVAKTIDGNKITLTIELGGKVMKQSQLEILLAKMDEAFTEVNTKIDVGLKEVNNKVDEVKTEFAAKIDEVNTKIDEVKTEFTAKIDEVNTKIDEVKTDVKEIKVILKKHDDLFVDHGWLNKSSF